MPNPKISANVLYGAKQFINSQVYTPILTQFDPRVSNEFSISWKNERQIDRDFGKKSIGDTYIRYSMGPGNIFSINHPDHPIHESH